MYYRLSAAILAVIAVPIAAVGQQPPAVPAQPSATTERRVCETSTDIGTRLSNVRRCRTRAERQAHKQEARETVDRMQALKVTFED